MYQYELIVRDAYENPIPEKDFQLEPRCQTKCPKVLTTNMVDNSGDSALRVHPTHFKSDAGSTKDISISSLAPGEFTQSLAITHKKWDNTYTEIAENNTIYVQAAGDNSFHKPHDAKLSKVRPTGPIRLGTKTVFNFQVDIKDTAVKTIPYVLEDFRPKIKTIDTVRHEVKDLSPIERKSGSNQHFFDLRITVPEKIATRNDTIGLQVVNPIIEYELDGHTIRYILTSNTHEYGLHPAPITYEENEPFLGVQVIGSIQSSGYGAIAIDKDNFADISTGDQRTIIRKNALAGIKNMKPGEINNRIKYVTGDIELPEANQNYDTLIVKNGNVKIVNDMIIPLGVIVLKDNYSVEKDFITAGNIYVKPHVQKIT